MNIKQREESIELKTLRFLNARMNLSPQDKKYYVNLKKGYEGELSFDEQFEEHFHGWLVLNDILLEHHNTLFQIDSLGISSQTIYLFEVKNFEGDFYIEGDRWYSSSKNEIKNPLLQLQRNESLLRRQLKELGFNFPIEVYLIFVNPEFHLYQAPLKSPIIYPPQLNRFKNSLPKITSTLQGTHSELAKQLLSLHQTDTPNFRLPQYDYAQLKKGIYCPKCYVFYQQCGRTHVLCLNCGEKEKFQTAVWRCVDEFKILFPDLKITTNRIHDWCEIIKDKRSVRKILARNYTIKRKGKASFYL